MLKINIKQQTKTLKNYIMIYLVKIIRFLYEIGIRKLLKSWILNFVLIINIINFINLRFPGALCSTKNNPRPWLQTLINKIKNNNEVKVHNINSYFNNVIDTKEIARFILMIIKKRKNIRDTFNLSASTPLKLKSIIDINKTKYHSISKIKNIEKKNKSFVLSINKIKKKLNFHPVSTKKIIMRNL